MFVFLTSIGKGVWLNWSKQKWGSLPTGSSHILSAKGKKKTFFTIVLSSNLRLLFCVVSFFRRLAQTAVAPPRSNNSLILSHNLATFVGHESPRNTFHRRVHWGMRRTETLSLMISLYFCAWNEIKNFLRKAKEGFPLDLLLEYTIRFYSLLYIIKGSRALDESCVFFFLMSPRDACNSLLLRETGRLFLLL